MQVPSSPPDIIRFDEFEVDIRAGQLFRRGLKISLREQPFQVLVSLLECPGRIVTREELRRRLWGEDLFVDFDNNLNTAIGRLREALGDSADHPRFIETRPRRGYRFIAPLAHVPVEESAGRKIRLAVLPFANLSGDPGQEYFSDGITEEIIVRLADLAPERLGVIARTTAMHYKGSHKDVARIGRELGLDYVLEGSVRREGADVRISVQLIQVSDQTHVWAHTYEAELGQIVRFERRLADAIARQMQSALPLRPRGAPCRTHMPDPQAHDACLKGLYHLSRYNPMELEKAAECFHAAIRLDAGYARAHAKLALCHTFAGYFGYVRPSVAYPKAEAAANRALELDETLADAHLALGFLRLFHNWDLPASERAFDRAVELSPSDPTARWSRAMFIGAFKEDHSNAAKEMAVAQELDPLSICVRMNAGWLLYWARQFDRAIAQARETIELDANCVQAYNVLGLSLISIGAPKQAVAVLDEAVRRFSDPLSLSWLGMAYGLSGCRREARAVLRQMEARAGAGYMPSLCLAWVHIGLGDHEAALNLIGKAYEDRDSVILMLRVSPTFDSLRAEPRYQRLLALLNLPEPSGI